MTNSHMVPFAAAMLAAVVGLSASAMEITPESGDWSGSRSLGAEDILVLDVSEGSTKAYSGSITGSGKVRKIGCGILQLTGDNSGFSGEWLVTTGRVEVTTTANLGSGSVKVWAEPNKYTGTLYFGCSSAQTFANPIKIMGPGAGYTLSGGGVDAYRQIHAKISGGKQGSVVDVTLSGEITAEEGCARFWVSSVGSYSALYVNRVNVPGVDFYPIENGGTLYLSYVRAKTVGGAICTKELYPGTASDYYSGSVIFQPTADVECDELAVNYVNIYLKKENTCVKSNGDWPVFNLARYCNAVGNSLIDLGGKNQTFDRMIGPERNPKNRGVPSTSCTGGRMRSTSASATVTLKGSADAETGLDVLGKVSLVWDPVDNYTQRFANSLSDMTGSLTVKGGTLEFTGETAFSNATAISVVDSAVFRNASTITKSLERLSRITVGRGATFNSRDTLQTFNGTTPITIDLANDAELYLPEHETVNVADIYIDGKRIAGGSYAADGARSFPQLKSGAIEAPVRPGDCDLFTWTDGGADKLLTTAANWKEPVKPTFEGDLDGAKFGDAGDEALVPDGAKIAYLAFTRAFALRPADAGASFTLGGGLEVEGANPVTIASGVHIPFSQTWNVGTAKLAFEGPLTGEAGTTISVNGTSEEISFTGGVGSTYPGSIAFCDAPNVKASGVNPFGGAGGLVSWSNTVNTAQKISLSNFSTEKDMLMHSTAADFDKIEITAGTAEFKGSFTSTRSLHFKANKNTKAVFSGPKLALNATFVAEGSGEHLVNAPLTATMIQTESSLITFGATGNRITHEVGINLEYLGNGTRTLKFATAEAFDDRTTLTLKALTSGRGTFDLCGYSQTFGTLTMLTTANARPTTVVFTNSGERATLHIVQKNERSRSDFPLAWIAGVISGPIDFWKSGVASTVVSNHIEAVGALKVTHAGLVFAANDGSWKNATDVVIADDPTEEIKTGEEPFIEVRSDNALGRKASLTISGKGTLRIAGGVRQHVRTCTAGDVELGAGVWRHGEAYSEANHTTPFIAGEGTLSIGGGLAIIFR